MSTHRFALPPQFIPPRITTQNPVNSPLQPLDREKYKPHTCITTVVLRLKFNVTSPFEDTHLTSPVVEPV